jgi:hypothetical protein
MPIYTSNVTSTTFSEVTSTKGVYTAMAGIQTTDSIEIPFQWYQSKVQSSGWQFVAPKPPASIPSNAQVLVLRASRGKENLMISCIRMPKFKETSVHIGVTVQP